METCRLNDFIDIAEFTLNGQDQYITIEIVPVQEIQNQGFDQLSVAQVQVTGNVLTPCYYFLEDYQDSQSLSVFQLEYQAEIEEMVIEQLERQSDDEDSQQYQEQPIGYDLLDILERQYQKFMVKNFGETTKNEILSSSTSVNGETNTQKSEDFDINIFQENPDYPYETRREKVQRYLKKRKNRNWNKKISYKCRKEVADSRLRVKGRFITRQQANKLLGVNTNGMSIDLIRTLLESKFGKEKDLQSQDPNDKPK